MTGASTEASAAGGGGTPPVDTTAASYVCTGADGIVDEPHAIGQDYAGPGPTAIDRYPLTRPYVLPSFDPLALWPVLPPFLIATAVGRLTLARTARLRRHLN